MEGEIQEENMDWRRVNCNNIILLSVNHWVAMTLSLLLLTRELTRENVNTWRINFIS